MYRLIESPSHSEAQRGLLNMSNRVALPRLSLNPSHTQQQPALSSPHLKVILQRTDALRRANPILKEEP